MITTSKPHFLLSALAAGLVLGLAGRLPAQTFNVLYTFTSRDMNFNSDGAGPYGRLVLSGNNLYGTAAFGGSSAYGTAFRVSTDGTDFTTLYNFTGGSDGGFPGLGGISGYGGSPGYGLVLSGDAPSSGWRVRVDDRVPS